MLFIWISMDYVVLGRLLALVIKLFTSDLSRGSQAFFRVCGWCLIQITMKLVKNAVVNNLGRSHFRTPKCL